MALISSISIIWLFPIYIIRPSVCRLLKSFTNLLFPVICYTCSMVTVTDLCSAHSYFFSFCCCCRCCRSMSKKVIAHPTFLTSCYGHRYISATLHYLYFNSKSLPLIIHYYLLRNLFTNYLASFLCVGK